jgi:rhodanese-related sulfurtransferase
MTARSRFLVSGIALCLGSCAQPVQEAPVVKAPAAAAQPKKPVRMNGRGKITSISLTDFFALQQAGKVLLIDARPGFFYGLGHIPGAINLPKADCDAQIVKREAEIKAALAENKTIVIYCTNLLCPDARAVAIHLAGYGYSSSTLTGGWESYKETGLPTE